MLNSEAKLNKQGFANIVIMIIVLVVAVGAGVGSGVAEPHPWHLAGGDCRDA